MEQTKEGNYEKETPGGGAGGAVVIPSTVTKIGTRAFSSCTTLTSVTMREGATVIGSHAFQDCTRLSSFTIPDSVTTIESYAFYGCDRLTALTLPAGMTKIKNCAFYGSGLTELVIPKNITQVETSAFLESRNLTWVFVLNSNTSFGGETPFGYCPNLTVYGFKSSKASTHCSTYDIPFVELESTFHFDLTTPETFTDGTDVTLAASITSDVLPLTRVQVEVRSTETAQTVLSTGCILDSVYAWDIDQGLINDDLDLGSLAAGDYGIRYTVTAQYGVETQGSTKIFTVSPSYCTLNGHTDSGALPHEDGTGHPHPLYLTCSRCGRDYFIGNLDGWTPWETTREPDCVNKGEQRRECIAVGCGVVQTEDIPALGHDWVRKTQDATCLAQGRVYKECTRCGATQTVTTIPVLRHSYVPDYTSPTEVVYTCVNGCQQSFSSQRGSAGTALEGYLVGSSRQISWSITPEGLATFAGLQYSDTILIGCYDEGGAFLGAKRVTQYTDGLSAQIKPGVHTVRFFWLGAGYTPLSYSQTVWGG